MKPNGLTEPYVTSETFNHIMEQMANDVVALRHALNIHAEILGCHRYILEKFVPGPLLETAVKEYSELRAKAIAEQSALEEAGNVPASETN